MIDEHEQFLARCCAGIDGVDVSEGAFSPEPAIWVGRREVAHFEGIDTLDVRLTKPVIATDRAESRTDERVTMRRNASDWIEIAIASTDDHAWATSVVHRAIEANRSTGADRVPARRRRTRTPASIPLTTTPANRLLAYM